MAAVVAGDNRIRDFPFNHPVATTRFMGLHLKAVLVIVLSTLDQAVLRPHHGTFLRWIDTGVTGRLVDKLSD